MTNEFALRASRMSLRTFISSHAKLGAPNKLTRMHQKACDIASKVKRDAKATANAKTKETGRIIVHVDTKVGDQVRVIEKGLSVMKTVKSLGKPFPNRSGTGERRYAYFD